jgi:hypothetical protein
MLRRRMDARVPVPVHHRKDCSHRTGHMFTQVLEHWYLADVCTSTKPVLLDHPSCEASAVDIRSLDGLIDRPLDRWCSSSGASLFGLVSLDKPFDGTLDRLYARRAARKIARSTFRRLLEGALDELYDTSLLTSSSIFTTGERVKGES